MTNLRLTRAQAMKLRGLMNMMYKAVEIAEEMGVSSDTIYRSYLPEGAPSVVDSAEHILINGPAFAAWAQKYLQVRKDRPRLVMDDTQAYCVTCNAVVMMLNPKKRDVKKGVARMMGKCPVCGKVVNRFMRGLL